MEQIALAYHKAGIALVAAVVAARRKDSKEQVARRFCMSKDTVRRMEWMYKFFAPPGVREAAQGIPLEALDGIAKQVKVLSEEDRPEVTRRCLVKAAGKTVDEAIDVAKELVTEFKTSRGYAPNRKQRLYSQRKADANGQRRLHGVFNDATLTRIERLLERDINSRLKQGVSRPEAFAESLIDAILGSKHAADGARAYQPGLLLPLRPSEGYFKDGKVYTFDGAGIPLSELGGLEIGDTGYAIVTAQDERGRIGAEAIPIKRFADRLQRLLLATETLVCPQPGCTQPAWRCQYHHVVAFSRGGATTTDNLMLLCPDHNATNDDNPAHPKNGRMERCPTTGAPIYKRTPHHPGTRNHTATTRKGWREETEAYLAQPTES
ncbi:HNH endonuclease [Corynebacterium sp. 153RC1]|uniref:HNH endonuclease signature motif containing protein n=2 Tax=Corynebacterium TaxID=1716 RepID=UPI00211BCB13|nr:MULTISPECIES: HNH endonuclease signature motif containing protein [unclassified Corynebacterium]MCQ9353083.1 HNH endonuclease [Corynebacterium sp. 209RC1]MCQ9355287.1 HNH endonuclease [Corynebacterium sp. 1222RC1]MCQ9357539.1 HNH endonuclease [Corynebacterium sp. 122RC1]MCQ9359116.1 HNH endonuclease [Corynebacterium sp. 142RC1]MCQ9361784.1 HNH endonuclease [Corynebacterium sp. 153RC1]